MTIYHKASITRQESEAFFYDPVRETNWVKGWWPSVCSVTTSFPHSQTINLQPVTWLTMNSKSPLCACPCSCACWSLEPLHNFFNKPSAYWTVSNCWLTEQRDCCFYSYSSCAAQLPAFLMPFCPLLVTSSMVWFFLLLADCPSRLPAELCLSLTPLGKTATKP